MGKTQWDTVYETSPDSIPVKRKSRKSRSKPAAPVNDDFFFDTSQSHGIKRISDTNGAGSWNEVRQKESPFKSKNWRTFRNASGAFDGETTDDDIVVRNVSNLSASSSLSWAEDAVETEFTDKIFGMWDDVQKVCIGEVAERPGGMPEHIFEECLTWKRAFPDQDLSRFSRPSDNDANLTPTETRFKDTQISCPSSPVYKSTTPLESPNNLVAGQHFKMKQRESPSYVSMWLSDCDTQHGRKYSGANDKAVDNLSSPHLPQNIDTMSDSTFGTGAFGDGHLDRRTMFQGMQQDSQETEISYARELGMTAGSDRCNGGDNTTSSDDLFKGQSKGYPLRPHAPFGDSHTAGKDVGNSRRSSKTFTISSEDTLAPPTQSSRYFSNNNYLDHSSSAVSSFQKADRTFDDGFHRYFSTPKVMGKDGLGTGQSLRMSNRIDEDSHLYRSNACLVDDSKPQKWKTDILDTSFETSNHQSGSKFQRDYSGISRTTARNGAFERKNGLSKMPPYPVPVVSITANTTSSSGTNHRGFEGNMFSSHTVVSKNRHWSRHSSTTTVSSTNSSTLMGPMHHRVESGTIPPISGRINDTFRMEHHQNNPFHEAPCHQNKSGSRGHRHHDFCHCHQGHLNPSLLPPITTSRNKRPENLQTQDISKRKSNRPFLYWLLDKVSPS